MASSPLPLPRPLLIPDMESDQHPDPAGKGDTTDMWRVGMLLVSRTEGPDHCLALSDSILARVLKASYKSAKVEV